MEKVKKAVFTGHPLCEICKAQGVIKAADVVDHVISHRGDEELFWNESNWQSLCFYHHNSKTAKYDGGFGNVRRCFKCQK